MTDVWSTPVASFDKASYTKGQLMTLTFSNVVDTESVTSPLPADTVSVTFTAADGATNTVNFPVPPVTQTIVSNPTYTVGPVTDTAGRVWTQGSNPLIWTATA